MGFVVAGFLFADLILEAQTLIHRVVELGEGVGQFAPGDEELETVRQAGILVIAPRQRRNFRGIGIDEVGLHQTGLHVDVEQLGVQLGQAFAVGGLFAAFADIGLDLVVIVVEFRRMPADFFQRLVKGHARPAAGREIDHFALIGHDGRAADHLRQMAHQLFREVHQILVGSIGPVEFAGGEFGIVAGVDAFVAEVAVQLEDLFKAAHQQALEIEFRRDAHVQLQVQGVVLRHEGLGRGAARDGLHHGRFHFHEAALLQKTAELADDQAALLEDFPRARSHDQIHIALAVARFRILEAVIFFRQRTHGARDQLDRTAVDGQLARLGAEQMAGNAHDVAHVQFFHHAVDVFGQVLARGVALDVAALILNVKENHLAEGSQRDDAARNGHHVALRVQLFPFQLAEVFQHPADGVFLAEIVREQGNPGVQKIAGLDHAILDDLVQGVASGEPLKHGHEVVQMGGLGIQLDFGLLAFFPIFHDSAPGGPAARQCLNIEWMKIFQASLSVKERPFRPVNP